MDEKNSLKKQRFIALLLLITFFICGFFSKIISNKVSKVMASEINGLLDNYTLYALEVNEDAFDAIEGDSLSLTIDETNFVGIGNCYLLTTKFVLTNIEEISLGNDLSVSFSVYDSEFVEDGFDIYYDYIDFTFRYMVNAKALMVPNQYASNFDELLVLYTYGVDNVVYPLSDLFTKVTESSEQYLLLDTIIPFNEILHLGTNWYIYYYGTWNDGYNEGYDDGYNDCLTLQDNEISQMSKLSRAVFSSMRQILSVKVLDNITIGMLVGVPMFLGVLILLWKMIGKG